MNKKYLSQFYSTSNNFTHLNLDGGVYKIPDNKLDDFYNKYNNSLTKKEKIHLVEVHCETGPILVDIDLKFSQFKINRQYKESDIQKIVEIYNSVIIDYINFDKSKLQCFVFEKPKPSSKTNYIKDGFHLMYPFIHTKPSIQFAIRNEVIKQFNNGQFLKHLELTNKLEDVFDDSIIYKNGWIMYGSSKPKASPYKLSYILNNDLNKIINTYEDIDLVKLLSIRRKEKIYFSKENKIEIINKFEKEISNKKERKKKNNMNINTLIYNAKNNKIGSDELAEIQELLNIISIDRIDNYNSWIEIGMCLYNIEPSPRLLEIWILNSSKSDNYNKGCCEKFWANFKNYDNNDGSGLTICSLLYWAKLDDLQAYNKYLEAKVNDYLYSLINANENIGHYDVAKVMYMVYKNRFVCASLKHNIWYEFNGIRWCPTDQGHSLKSLISEEIKNLFIGAAIYSCNKARECKDNEKLMKFSEKCLTIAGTSLKTAKYKKDVMEECKALFYNKKFLEKLDSNIYLIGFENGIYDLKNKNFRNGTPDDYISFSTNIDYIEYDETSEKVQQVYNIFKEFQPKNELFHYLLSSLASYLDGQIADEKFIIWTGTGANGKSKTVEFFEDTFGDYCTKLPISLLTKTRGASNAASPDVAKTPGKRFAVMQEPEEHDKINVGLMKELSGGDKIEARGLYKEPFIFRPQFKMLLTCNELPNIPSSDGGTWRRLRVLPFNSKFVDNPDPDPEKNEFKKDPYFIEKVQCLKSEFMSILIHYYKDYSQNGLKEPPEVKKFTKEYEKKSDIYSEFVEEHIIENNTNDKTTTKEFYSVFKDWYRDNRPSEFKKSTPSTSEFKKYLTKKFGDPKRGNGGYWTNIKIKFDESEIDNLSD